MDNAILEIRCCRKNMMIKSRDLADSPVSTSVNMRDKTAREVRQDRQIQVKEFVASVLV